MLESWQRPLQVTADEVKIPLPRRRSTVANLRTNDAGTGFLISDNILMHIWHGFDMLAMRHVEQFRGFSVEKPDLHTKT